MRTLSPLDGIRLLLTAAPRLTLRPSGCSMVPAIYPGDRVTLAPAAQVRPGDVVLAPGPRLHRVVRVEGDTVVTRGDAAGREDPPTPLTELVARVTRVRPCWSARARFGLRRALRRLRAWS